MMKNIEYTLTLLLLTLLAACTEKVIDSGQRRPTSVKVTTEAFSPVTGETRITETDYTTVFESGDLIGVFVVAGDGTVLHNNVPYEYDGTNWTPVNVADGIYSYTYGGVKYTAYYPYSDKMNDITSEDDIISKSIPLADQSTLENYRASDLLTGEGTVSEVNGASVITIKMQHSMALLVMEPEAETDNIQLTVKTSSSTSYVCIPYHPSSTIYKFLIPTKFVNSSSPATLSFRVGQEDYSYSLSTVSAGKYMLMKVRSVLTF